MFRTTVAFSVALVGADVDLVATNINNRFNNGKISSDLYEAGVAMHQWDNLEAVDYGELWRPYTPEECTPETKHANCQYSDRESSLLSNNLVRNPDDGNIPLFTYERGGVINNPKHTFVMCAYSEDGGTMNRTNRGCGCPFGDTQCEQMGFNDSCALGGDQADFARCWWGQKDIDKMMEHQEGVYNELVVDTDTWLENLPNSIEAFFYIKGNAASETESRDCYNRFVAKYPNSGVPLLALDYTAKTNPFSVDTAGNGTTTTPSLPATTATPTTTAPSGSGTDALAVSVSSIFFLLMHVLDRL